MFGEIPFRKEQVHAPGHAKVADQVELLTVLGQCEEKILPPAFETGESRAYQGPGEVSHRSRADHLRSADVDGADDLASEQRAQMADENFDFGQFGHEGRIG